MPPRLLPIALLLAFWLTSLAHLDTVPPVYEDEPWQASTGWKLATEGVFGSDLFRGYYGMERHYYGYMPLHPLLLAAVFRLAGLGLFQARLEAVILTTFTLALTYALGRRLAGRAAAGLAVGLLLLARTGAHTPSQYTGIVLVDVARIARYDAAVPVFGLLSLHALWTAGERRGAAWYGLAGLLAALAGLSHLYGLFWLP
ncbi:MAG: glycosyltransferase family 39 protein, partial [Candidatus Promineifilaceae bacterium]